MRRDQVDDIADLRAPIRGRQGDHAEFVAKKGVGGSFGSPLPQPRRRSVGCQRLEAGIDRDVVGLVGAHHRRAQEQRIEIRIRHAVEELHRAVIHVHEEVGAGLALGEDLELFGMRSKSSTAP